MTRHQDLSAVLAPLERAHGLPNAHYVSSKVYDRECRRLLFEGWAGIGFASDIAVAGAVMPVDFAGQPLVAVRGRDGAVRVFQNVCRHRGMILVEEKKRLGGLIRCPYHSWCYALSGELVATPHVGGPGMNSHPGICREELGLVEIRSAVWHDVIFVNVGGDAPPFEEYAGAAIARWREFEGQPFICPGPESRFSLDVACNWKLAVENYCESYHLPWVHPGLNSYSRLEDHYHIEEPGAFSGQGTRVYRQLVCDEVEGRRFPDYAGLSEGWRTGAEYIALYPNVLFGVHRDHAFAIVLEPKGPERTVEHVAIHYADPALSGAEWEEMRRRNAQMWRGVFEEDVFVVEGMQKGRHAAHFDGGRFSPAMDGPTHLFHAWVAGRMRDG
ncbi:MAG: aromatic ring-hydroxylating dioxygenase subunit alpha [Alphaproteobacteria bacterium]|nr:MAG: aromatic ring-hydroxylating dioxygenase subunit alpha [Alphaproteobacteria bacterium]